MAADIEEVLRKHGYAAKNDMIARYMQATFESHIAARKKLLQEVSSKGRASPDVLEAARKRPRGGADRGPPRPRRPGGGVPRGRPRRPPAARGGAGRASPAGSAA